MKEITFIRKNIAKWEQSETIVQNAAAESPDRLADVYVDITSDLSFAQTHYPQSRITTYLNNLASAIHNEIYQNKHEPRSRFITFWTHEVPRAMYDARKLLLASFLIFAASVFIGVISQMIDDSFCRLIMGNSYMDMTEQNIADGTPMGVYGNENPYSMFYGITFNNIRVSFSIFVSGLTTSLSTGFYLMYNGVMIGTFWSFFAQRNLLDVCLQATMLHGTLELSAIIVAGSAGLALGNGWLFPGTYSRLRSFQRGAKRGLKIVVGTVPIFVVAGFIESYLTRHTDMPLSLKLTIIILSAIFILFYFVIWPYLLHRMDIKKTSNISQTSHTQLFSDYEIS